MLVLGALIGVKGTRARAARDAIETEIVTDRSYGVTGDGLTNDRARLQSAIDASVGKTLMITGKSRIDAAGLDLRSGSHVRFAPGASIKLLPHDTPSYQIVRIWDAHQILLENATLDGSKELNTAKKDRNANGYGMGISIAGSSNVTIASATTQGCWGDGLYIANSYHYDQVVSSAIRVLDHHANQCRRQGASIISGKDILIERAVWENIGGTSPSAGLDIEPNTNWDVLENIRIVSPTTRNCRVGILVFLKEIPGPLPKNIQIDISDHRDESSTDAPFSVSGLNTNGRVVTGHIASRSPTWVDPRLASVESIDYDKRGPAIIVTGQRIIP